MTNLRKAFASIVLILAMIATSSLAWAQSSPVTMLEQVTNQMLTALKNTQSRSPQTLYSLVRNILLPHVNVDLMSQQVVGRYWAQASAADREEFKNQFTFFVTRTYSSALSSYSNQKVRYFPIRGGAGGSRVQVNSAIDQDNGQPVSVSYRLIQEGGWKIYDFSVEGVSLVDNYRAQFADILRTEGLAGLNQRLKAKNSGR